MPLSVIWISQFSNYNYDPALFYFYTLFSKASDIFALKSTFLVKMWSTSLVIIAQLLYRGWVVPVESQITGKKHHIAE